MANDSYTLIIVPHAKARFRKVSISVRLAKWALGLGAAGVLGLTGLVVHYSRIAVEVQHLRSLRAENATLRAKTRQYEANAGQLQSQVADLQKLVNKLGVMAGVDQTLPDAAAGGLGGVSSLESRAPGLDGLGLGTMEKAVSDLTERSERLEEFYRDQKVLLASTPSIWPVRGYLSSGFGNRIDPFTGQKDFHPGIDISTPIGAKIHAPADGVVVFVGRKGAYGNAIVINHGYGIMTRYGHMSGFNVKPGQRVHRGDVIGFVGSTGRSTSPHCHYEVWVHNQAQNPIHYILDEYRSFG